MNNCIIKLFYMLPINHNLIVFESEGDLSDNAYALYTYLIEHDKKKKYTFVWLVDDVDKSKNKEKNAIIQKKFPFFITMRRDYYLATCKWYIYDHCNVLRDVKKREGQRIIYLSHGSILKKAKGTTNEFWNNDEFYITGSAFLEGMQDWTKALKSQIIDIGFPRLDYFFKKDSNVIRKFLIDNHFANYNKIFIWMPTYRQSYNNDLSENYLFTSTGLPLFESVEQIEDFNSFLCEKNSLCIIKQHHLQIKLDVFTKEYSNIKMVNDEDLSKANIQLYELVKHTDALITDWSSIAFDYMILNRPIVFTQDDLDQYNRNRGFIKDPNNLFIGYKCYTLNDFYKALTDICKDNDLFKNQRTELMSYIHTHIDGNACKRIVDRLGL